MRLISLWLLAILFLLEIPLACSENALIFKVDQNQSHYIINSK